MQTKAQIRADARAQKSTIEEDWRAGRLGRIPAHISPELRINGYRCVGACTWTRLKREPVGVVLAMLAWTKPCKTCGAEFLTLCRANDIAPRWFTLSNCPEHREKKYAKLKTPEKRAARAQWHAQRRAKLAADPQRIARLVAYVGAHSGRLATSPLSPDYFIDALHLDGSRRIWRECLRHCLDHGILVITKVGAYKSRNPKLGLTLPAVSDERSPTDR